MKVKLKNHQTLKHKINQKNKLLTAVNKINKAHLEALLSWTCFKNSRQWKHKSIKMNKINLKYSKYKISTLKTNH